MIITLDNGVRIYYEVRDENNANDTVILIHHLAGSKNSWKYIYPTLSRKYKVLVYDLRGHGRSSIPPAPYLIEEHSEDLRKLLEIEGIKEPIIVGHSLGTLIAIDYALKNSVKKLVLIGALYKAPAREPYEKMLSIALSLGMEALADYRRKINDFAPTLYGNPRAWNDLLSVYRENTPIGYKYAVEGLLNARDYSEELTKLDIETLLLYGSEDKLSQNLNLFKSKIKDAKSKVFASYGHFLNFEMPEELTKELLNFLYKSP
ncbi:alpha/beta fold hydrolase [Stygiolobus caldivivus]|uniref:Alpha/beta hydrolase n=1 Tax=Stygiolobus caldivivus TaxID=2824673 RepID=A0A8D5ZKE7_9CREN|nr:alpha/beta hydrolase [Stygiolobus caldivivus]BCU71310.1 alpha/beta hydrolase [Stygiolobus caldivivus]